ncbi:TRAF-like family protein [Euphorbia peplus]|nr:TRAF-like family protein [Euphorbia peplus]
MMMKSKRDTPPAHYILKINSFFRFSETLGEDDGMYKSNEFEAADYKWKLVVYPNGNGERNGEGNGEGHISLYLASTDKKVISSGCHVNALITFFVYDHLRDDYLTIQDGKSKRFNVLRTEHGLDQLLPLATFNDPSNGFLDPPNGTFTWKIEKFSTLGSEDFYSEVFSAGGHEWKLNLYPKGELDERDCNMSLYLCLEERNQLNPCQNKVYLEFTLLVKDQLNGIHYWDDGHGWLEDDSGDIGFGAFMQLKKLRKASNGYLVNDTLVIEANITLISVSQDLIC